MNPFKKLIYNQYYSLQKKGQEELTRKYSTIYNSLILVMLLIGLFFCLLIFIPDFDKEISKFIRRTFGRSAGKSIGQILAIILFLISYLIIRLTVGTKKYHNKIIIYFNTLSENEKEVVSKNGFKFFTYSILFMVISIVTMIIKTYIF